MKISAKLIIPTLVFSIIFSIVGTYIVMEIEKIQTINHEFDEANEISLTALDFNVENFHTQLEVWEYAYEPNQIRLDAFESHKKTLNELAERLNEEVEEEATVPEEDYHGLYPNAVNDVKKIINNLSLVEDDWVLLIDAVTEYRNAKESGVSNEELERYDTIMRQKVNENEDLFDNLEFDKSIDIFVLSQSQWAKDLEIEHDKILSNFITSLYVIIPVTIVCVTIFSLVISKNITKPLIKLRDVANEIAKGNLNMRTKISGNDEISELSSDVNKMQDSLLQQKQELIKNEKINALGSVTSSLAHNLKNPLSVIKATTSIIEVTSNSVDEKTRERLNLIKISTENMLNQIEDILDFVKQKPLELKETSLFEILNIAVNNIAKPEKIKINLPEKDIKIKCDSSKLQVVFMNMIKNSIESIEGDGEITIDSSQNMRETAIEITDTGSLNPSEFEKMFDVLYTTKPTGTGLGLPYCKSVIDQHGGNIEVSMNPTKFTIIIPRSIKPLLNLA